MRFYNFSNICISGASGAGKSKLMQKIIVNRDQMFFTFPTRIIIVYSNWQEIYEELERSIPDIIFMQNFPSETELDDLVKDHEHSIFIADDKGIDAAASPFIAHLFSRLSHHKRITSILLLQNSNLKGKYAGDILRNCQYNILMRGGKEAHSIRALGIQLCDYANLISAFRQATEKDLYSYLCVNTHSKVNGDFGRYYTNILQQGEGEVTLFLPKR